MSEQTFQLFRKKFDQLDAMSQRQLFFEFRKMIYPHIFFIVNDHVRSDDVIQEAFIKAIREGPETYELVNMTDWLKKIARNTAFHFISNDIVIIKNENSISHNMSNVQESLESDLHNGILYNTVKDLKPSDRMIIYLYYIAGLPCSEIGKELGISQHKVSQRMARARKKLTKLFKRKWEE